MAYVFISYSRADLDYAKGMAEELRGCNFDVWIDENKLVAGDDWQETIDADIRAAFALIILVTPNSVASGYVNYEWAFAYGSNVPVIPLLVEDANMHPRLAKIHYLDFRRGKRPIQSLINILNEKSKKALPVTEEVKDFIHQLRENKSELLRTRAADELGKLRAERSLATLIAALYIDSSSIVRQSAAKALSKISRGNEEALQALVDTLYDPQEEVRKAAAASLGSLADKRVTSQLLDILADRYYANRMDIVMALGLINDPEAIPSLISYLNDEIPHVRYAAALALGNAGSLAANAIPRLAELLQDETKPEWVSHAKRICDVAADTLEKIGTSEAKHALRIRKKKLGK